MAGGGKQTGNDVEDLPLSGPDDDKHVRRQEEHQENNTAQRMELYTDEFEAKDFGRPKIVFLFFTFNYGYIMSHQHTNVCLKILVCLQIILSVEDHFNDLDKKTEEKNPKRAKENTKRVVTLFKKIISGSYPVRPNTQ